MKTIKGEKTVRPKRSVELTESEVAALKALQDSKEITNTEAAQILGIGREVMYITSLRGKASEATVKTIRKALAKKSVQSLLTATA